MRDNNILITKKGNDTYVSYDNASSEKYGGKIHNLKRRIKKKSQFTTNIVSTNNTYQKCKQNKISTESNNIQFGKYKYPKHDEIKSGRYFSRIDFVKKSKTYSGKDAIEIFYSLWPAVTCYKIATSQITKVSINDIYHIKQKYPIDSGSYENFLDSMTIALGKKDFNLNETKNVTEYITLGYDLEYSKIGGFVKREYTTWKELEEWCIEDYNRKQSLLESENIVEENNNSNENEENDNVDTTDDDEFDDFDDFYDFFDDEEDY